VNELLYSSGDGRVAGFSFLGFAQPNVQSGRHPSSESNHDAQRNPLSANHVSSYRIIASDETTTRTNGITQW
jgi:hypothetical protein